MRSTVQALFFILFCLLFFLAAYPMAHSVPVDLFLRIDPLIALSTFLASRELHAPLLVSFIVIAASLLFGRFFCGYVCPLGTVIDYSHRFLVHRKKTNAHYPALRNIKYYLAVALVACALFGFNLVYLFDPLSVLTRVFTFLVYPFSVLLLNTGLDVLRPLAEALRLVALSHKHVMQPLFYMTFITLLVFSALLALNFFTERFWCRNLCPLGALISICSRWGIFKRQVSDACNRCMICYRECPMGAIADNPVHTRGGECFQCLHCAAVCPQTAISFTPARRLSPAGFNPAFELTRRNLFLSLGAGALTAFSLTTAPFVKHSAPRLIRPPGALPEKIFLKRCVRCGACMKACPTNTLQPCLWESGLNGLWSPRLVPRLAGCDQTCNACGRVCPTGALRDLPLEEKRNAKLGTAVIDRERCLVWADNTLCLICDEQCPYNAIIFKWNEGARRPFVVATKCNGCGFCEEKCPVRGESAIMVTPRDEIRLASGSYIEAAKQLQLEFREDPGTDRFLLDETPESGAGPSAEKTGSATDKIPEGFQLK